MDLHGFLRKLTPTQEKIDPTQAASPNASSELSSLVRKRVIRVAASPTKTAGTMYSGSIILEGPQASLPALERLRMAV